MIRSTVRRAAAVIGIASTFTALSVTGAHAQETRLVDTRGDVWASVQSAETYAVDFERTLDAGYADITRVVIRHGNRNVMVRARYVDLRRNGNTQTLDVAMRTDEGQRRWGGVVITSGFWRGDSGIVRGRALMDCGVTHRVDYANDTITVSFPRTCLSNPRWVQFQVSNTWEDDDSFLMENAHNDRAATRGWTPRVRRG